MNLYQNNKFLDYHTPGANGYYGKLADSQRMKFLEISTDHIFSIATCVTKVQYYFSGTIVFQPVFSG